MSKLFKNIYIIDNLLVLLIPRLCRGDLLTKVVLHQLEG